MGRMKGIIAAGPGDLHKVCTHPRVRDFLVREELARLVTGQYRKVRRERDLIR